MIAYFDTSAVVPLLVSEAGTTAARTIWDASARVATVRLTYPETRAALGRARREGRLAARQLRVAVGRLDDVFEQLDVIELDPTLAHDAGEFAERLDLRGYDAVHLAAVHRLRDEELVVTAGDRALLAAATRLGLATAFVG